MQTLVMLKVIVRQATLVIAEHIGPKVETHNNGNSGPYVDGVDKNGNPFGPYDYATYTFELSVVEVEVTLP